MIVFPSWFFFVGWLVGFFVLFSSFSSLVFLVVLGLHSCVWDFSCCGEQGLLFVMEHRF